MQTDPETIATMVREFEGSDALGNGDFSTCVKAADMIEALQAEIAELRSWKAAEDVHHHLLRQQAKDGFAAGVEAAAKVAATYRDGASKWHLDSEANPSGAGYCCLKTASNTVAAIRSLLQTSEVTP